MMIHSEGVDLHQKGCRSKPSGYKIKNTVECVKLTPLSVLAKLSKLSKSNNQAKDIGRLVEWPQLEQSLAVVRSKGREW